MRLTVSANFDGENRNIHVVRITRTGTLQLEDGSYLTARTFELCSVHPEINLHKRVVTGKRGDDLHFWE